MKPMASYALQRGKSINSSIDIDSCLHQSHIMSMDVLWQNVYFHNRMKVRSLFIIDILAQ